MRFSTTRAARTDVDLSMQGKAARLNRRNSVQTHIEYGMITEVDYETCKVKVMRLTTGKELVNGEGNFHWLLNPITEIHMLYGPLMPGMKCRIHWEGPPGSEPGKNIAVEVLGSTTDRLDEKEYASNTIAVGAGSVFK